MANGHIEYLLWTIEGRFFPRFNPKQTNNNDIKKRIIHVSFLLFVFLMKIQSPKKKNHDEETFLG